MRFQHILFILIISIVFAGCASCEEQTPVNKNTNSTPKTNQKTPKPDDTNQNVNNKENTNETNTDKPKGTDSTFDDLPSVPKDTKQVEAVTLKPTLLAYCDAMRKKDEEGLRKVFSAATLKSFEKDMKDDGIKTLVEFLENESVDTKCELVNETIQGLTGEAKVITDTYPVGTQFKFVKENNEWKLTNESSDVDQVIK